VLAQSSKVPFNQNRNVPFIEATIEPWKGAESGLINEEPKRIDPIRSDEASAGKTAEPGRSQRDAGGKRAAGETVVCSIPEGRRARSAMPPRGKSENARGRYPLHPAKAKATGCPQPATHSLTSVVLPNPAEAEMSVSLRLARRPSFNRSFNRGRRTTLGRGGGI